MRTSITSGRHAVATTIALLAVLVAAAGVSNAVHDASLLELDGDVADASGPGLPYDWASLFAADGSPLVSGAPLFASAFIADHGAPDPTQHAGSDKDTEDMSTWQCAPAANPQDKTDILNGYAALYVDGNGDRILYFGFERATNNGNSFMGFWFFQRDVGCDPAFAPGNFTGEHVEGDLLVLSDFTGGGSVSNVQVLRWDPTAPDNLAVVFSGVDCASSAPGDAACGRVNPGPLNTPWAPGDAQALGENQFFEAGINLDALLGFEEFPCFTSFMAETRVSQSVTAELKDYASTTFETCDARISITPQLADNDVGDPHTYTVTVEKDTGNGFEPAPGVLVNATLDGVGDFVGPDHCTTGADGTCTVEIISTEAGTTTVTAEANVTIGEAVFPVATDGQGGNSPPAQKNWHKLASTTTTTPTSASITLGGSVADTVVVSGDLGTPTGNVSFFVCAEGVVPCTAGGTFLSEETLDGAGEATSAPFTPLATGTYCFRGEYEGDGTYEPSTDSSLGECFDVTTAASSTLTMPANATITLGEANRDTVVVTGLGGAFPAPTGTVTFFLCAPDELDANGQCSAGGGLFDTRDLDANGEATSSAVTPSHAGTWCFRGEYSGDANYAPSTDHSTGECFTVAPADPGLSTQSNPSGDVAPDTAVTDAATLTGLGPGFPAPTGTVTFFLCTPQEVDASGCPTGTQVGAPVGLSPDGTATSATTTPVSQPVTDPAVLGTYCWRATYSGDANYAPAAHTDASNECFTVKSPVSTLAKAVRVLPDGAFDTTATAEPGDSLEYRLTYENIGNADATNVVLTDQVRAHSTWVSCDPACTVGGTGAPGDAITFSLGTVGPGDQVVVTFVVQLDAVFPAGTTTIENTAVASTDEEDEDTESNKTTTEVDAAPDLQLVKSADRSEAGPSQNITYTLVFWNQGNADATNTVVTEEVPAGTSFVDCTPTCTVAGSTVTWDVGTVPAHGSAQDPAGSVTLTVHVDIQLDCEICNIAHIASPDQDAGAPQASNEVCTRVGADPTRANASGAATGLHVRLDGLALSQTIGRAESSQSGLGSDSDHANEASLAVPDETGVEAELVTTTSVSTITRDPASATTTATSEIVGLDVLDGLVTASTARAVATASATGSTALVSAAGSTLEGVSVMGTPVENVAPNTRIELPAALFGPDSFVVLFGIDSTVSTPPAGTLVGGTYAADATVTMVHVVITDLDPVTPGEQGAEVVVASATAYTDFPQTPLCDPDAHGAVGGHAFAASASTTPPLAPATVGLAAIGPTGGSSHQELDDTTLGDGNVTTSAAVTDSQGSLTETASTAASFAEVHDVCLAPVDGVCTIAATTVRSDAGAEATSGGASATGNAYLEDLVIAGSSPCVDAMLEGVCAPQPNMAITVPGIGFVVLNEQLSDADEDGAAGLTVRAVRLVVTVPDNPTGLAPGAEVIVAESYARAVFVDSPAADGGAGALVEADGEPSISLPPPPGGDALVPERGHVADRRLVTARSAA